MTNQTWRDICDSSDIALNTGVCALLENEQVAIFKVGPQKALYAVQNYCPFGQANVLSRGLVGDKNGEVVLASPLYKQLFALESGKCLDDDSVQLKVYPVREHQGVVQLAKN